MGSAWEIVGFEGITEIYRRQVPTNLIGSGGIEGVLRRLACRHLNIDEVIDSSLRKNAKRFASHLDVVQNHDAPTYSLMTTGSGAHYFARVIEGDKDAVR